MTIEDVALRLLIPLWRGVDAAYKIKYAGTIWEQFENQIRSAAYTSNAQKFLDGFVARMRCQISSHDLATVTGFMQECGSPALLKMLREQTTLLVLHVRVANEIRKEDWRKENPAENPAEKEDEKGDLFGDL